MEGLENYTEFLHMGVLTNNNHVKLIKLCGLEFCQQLIRLKFHEQLT